MKNKSKLPRAVVVVSILDFFSDNLCSNPLKLALWNID